MTGRFRVKYSPAAKDDLRGIAAYILYALRAPQAAKRITSEIRNEIRSLSDMPERYALVEWEPWSSMKMHRVPVGNYVIFYLIDDASHTVTVARIFYGGRDIAHMVQNSE